MDQISATRKIASLEHLGKILCIRMPGGVQSEDGMPEAHGLSGHARLSPRECNDFSKDTALLEDPKENTHEWSRNEKAVLTVHQA